MCRLWQGEVEIMLVAVSLEYRRHGRAARLVGLGEDDAVLRLTRWSGFSDPFL